MPKIATELHVELDSETSKIEQGKTLSKIYITKYTNKRTRRIGYCVMDKNGNILQEASL